MDKELSPLEHATKVAYEAGEVLRHYFGKKLHHYVKGESLNDFATKADLSSEKLIIRYIQEHFPNDGIIAEESQPLIPHVAQNIWIVDPLDGTYNFAHGIGDCGVMITRAGKAHIELAVLYNPFKNVVVTAERNKGVFVDGEQKRFDMFDHDLRIIADKNGFAPLLRKHGYRGTCLWSSVDNALLMLTGEKNVYFNKTAKVWDLAPLSLCFEEYGLRVITPDQKPYQWQSKFQALIALPQEKLTQLTSVFLEG